MAGGGGVEETSLRCLFELKLYKRDHKVQSVSCVALGCFYFLLCSVWTELSVCLCAVTSVTHSVDITGPVLEVGDSQELKGSQLNPEWPLSQPVLEYDA